MGWLSSPTRSWPKKGSADAEHQAAGQHGAGGGRLALWAGCSMKPGDVVKMDPTHPRWENEGSRKLFADMTLYVEGSAGNLFVGGRNGARIGLLNNGEGFLLAQPKPVQVTPPHPESFPVLGRAGHTVPWAMLVPHEEQARRNHGGQSLKRLAERGGLDWSELLAVLRDQDWQNDPDAKDRVLDRVKRWKADDAKRVEAAAAVIFGRMDLRGAWPDAKKEDRDLFLSIARDALQAALA